MTTAPKVEFINAFEKKILEPRGLDYKIMFPGPTGTNAVESALKIARKATGRKPQAGGRQTARRRLFAM